jgi:plasmid stabilization system protein ParE
MSATSDDRIHALPVPYRVREETVEILRVFHTARKWPEAL